MLWNKLSLVKPVITPPEAQWLIWLYFYYSNHPFGSTLIWWHNLLCWCRFLEHLHRCSVCDRGKIFFTSKFSYLIFCNPTHKTETGTANRWGTTNSKLPVPIIMMAQSETLISSQVIFVTLVSAGAHSCCAVHQSPQTLQLCWAKTIFPSQTSKYPTVLSFVPETTSWSLLGLRVEVGLAPNIMKGINILNGKCNYGFFI
jgi:hypothetical protein